MVAPGALPPPIVDSPSMTLVVKLTDSARATASALRPTASAGIVIMAKIGTCCVDAMRSRTVDMLPNTISEYAYERGP